MRDVNATQFNTKGPRQINDFRPHIVRLDQTVEPVEEILPAYYPDEAAEKAVD